MVTTTSHQEGSVGTSRHEHHDGTRTELCRLSATELDDFPGIDAVNPSINAVPERSLARIGSRLHGRGE